MKRSEGKWRKIIQRGVHRSDWGGVDLLDHIRVEREELFREIIADQIDQIRADWSKQRRMKQAARNKEIRFERSEKILKEIN